MTDGFTPRPAFPVRSGSVPARPAFPIARAEPVVDVTVDRDQEAKRAIEAVVLAAIEPVEPQVLARARRDPGRRGRAALHGARGGVRATTGAASCSSASPAATGSRRTPTWRPTSSASCSRASTSGSPAPALETLAIVAYKQPISRGQLAAIRGVNVESTLSTLIQRGLRRGDRPRPRTRAQAILYGTTTLFLERLGLDSLRDLPPLGEFVPDASVVEALERGLRLSDDPTGGRGDGCARARSRSRRLSAPSQRPERDQPERVQKVLARAGLGSRRVCEDLIAAGRVTVDGERGARRPGRLATHGSRSTACRSSTRTDLVYYLLNKPARVVTTADDPEGRPTVVELVPAEPRVFPVGRLDCDTEGLLLLTNDGDLTQRLTHPSHGVEKEYLVEVDGVPGRGDLRRLREGVELDDGVTAPARASGPGPGRRRRRARDRDPRGPQPSGPAHVRRGRPSGAPAGAHPHRSRSRPTTSRRGSGGSCAPRGPRSVRGGVDGCAPTTRQRAGAREGPGTNLAARETGRRCAARPRATRTPRGDRRQDAALVEEMLDRNERRATTTS